MKKNANIAKSKVWYRVGINAAVNQKSMHDMNMSTQTIKTVMVIFAGYLYNNSYISVWWDDFYDDGELLL